jgi:acyl-CoA thioesterase FadM
MFGEEVTVDTRIDRIGRSSLAMAHRMAAGDEGRLAGEASTVLVTYDYAAARPIDVPEEWRARMMAHEGRPLETDAPRREAAAAT